MNWETLPIELRVQILSMRHNMREDSQKTIVRCWVKFLAPKKIAQCLVERERNRLSLDVMFPETANVMEYCTNVLSGKEDPKFWKEVLLDVDYELWVNEYTGGPRAKYYKRNKAAFDVLTRTFGYRTQFYIT